MEAIMKTTILNKVTYKITVDRKTGAAILTPLKRQPIGGPWGSYLTDLLNDPQFK
jgi:hypothetical protein